MFRALAQGQFGRFGQGPRRNTIQGEAAHTIPFGLMSPAQMFAMKVQRFMHEHGVAQVVRVCVCVLARTRMRGTLSGHVSVRAIVRPCVRARVRVCAHMRDARKDGRNVDLLLPAVGTASQQAA